MTLEGRSVLIKRSDDFSFSGRPKRSGDDANGDGNTDGHGTTDKSTENTNSKIFIGNLSFDCTKESVSEAFKQFGEFVEIRVAAFEDSGRCKGYVIIVSRFVE